MMEDLIGIVRANDPGTIPLVGGLDWSYDLSGVREDPVRAEGIAYVTHPYPQKRSRPWEPKWEETWGFVADTYPVFATELGFMSADGPGAHIPVIADESYGEAIVAFFEARGISWAAVGLRPAVVAPDDPELGLRADRPGRLLPRRHAPPQRLASPASAPRRTDPTAPMLRLLLLAALASVALPASAQLQPFPDFASGAVLQRDARSRSGGRRVPAPRSRSRSSARRRPRRPTRPVAGGSSCQRGPPADRSP